MDVIFRTIAQIITSALDRLITQFRDKSNLRETISGFLAPAEDVEDTISDLRDSLSVDIATGDALDKIGEWVGESRQGRSDETYRLFIKARISINQSLGQPDQLIDIVTSLSTATEGWAALTSVEQAAVVLSVELSEAYPAYFSITFSGHGLTSDDAANLLEIIDDADPAAVGKNLIYATTDDALFRFDGDNTTEGFDSGKLAEAI